MKKLLYISLAFNCLALLAGMYMVHRFGGWKNIKYRIANRGLTKIYEHRKNQFKNMPGRDSSIFFLGNSITEQCEWAELLNNPNIVNRGIAGDHCDGVGERLDDLKKLNPTKIFLMIGVNDLAFHPSEVVLEKYKKLIPKILSSFPSAVLFLESVLPVNNLVGPLPMQNEDIETLNKGIKKIAKKYNLTYLNLHPLLLDKNGNLDARYTMDGIHLNGEGYLKLKPILEKTLAD